MAEILYTIDGETRNIKQWCKIYDINESTVRRRMLRKGMTFEEALKTKKKFDHKLVIVTHDGVKKKKESKGYKAKPDGRCRRCQYGEKSGTNYVCMYIDLHPDHNRRGCEAGTNCAKWEKRSRTLTEGQKRLFKSAIYGRGE